VEGHIWWTVCDTVGLKGNVFIAPWTESTRMAEYVVDMGTFHTVPVFFLVSGYLTSLTLTSDNAGICRFFKHRAVRLWPPFFAGVLCLFISRAISGEISSVSDMVFSHLWFLWALFLIQSIALPYSLMVRMLCRRHLFSKKRFSVCMVIHCVILILLDVVIELVWKVNADGKIMWLFTLPVGTLGSLLFFWAPFGGGEIKEEKEGKDDGEGKCALDILYKHPRSSIQGNDAPVSTAPTTPRTPTIQQDVSKCAGFLFLFVSIFVFLGSVAVAPLSKKL